MHVLPDLGEDEPVRRHVIKGTCKVCGLVPGCQARDLTFEEAHALRELGYELAEDVFGDDIAAPPDTKGHFNQALAHYHRAGHPKSTRPTWQQLLLVGLEDEERAEGRPPTRTRPSGSRAERTSGSGA